MAVLTVHLRQGIRRERSDFHSRRSPMTGGRKCRNGVAWGSYGHSRSLEIYRGTNRYCTYEFLYIIAFHSNSVPPYLAQFLR